MQEQPHTVNVRVGVEMIDARRVERARAPDDAVDFVTFFDQKIGQVTPVLSRNPCDKRFFHCRHFVIPRESLP
jgi:hypothetical protein